MGKLNTAQALLYESDIVDPSFIHVPLALRVDWRMMNILQEDDKIVDLITFIGEAFPKNNFLTDSNTDTIMQTDHLRTTSSHTHTPSYNSDSQLEADTNGLGGGVNLDQSAECLMECFVESGEPLIRALIKPHEGTYSHQPFDIHPKQIVSYSVIQFSPCSRDTITYNSDLLYQWGQHCYEKGGIWICVVI